MKRLALVLAAALFGTGCFYGDSHTTYQAPPCNPTVAIDWTFRTADGAVVGCTAATAVIDSVDVYVDDVYWNTFACGPGGVTIPVSAGVHRFTVEGWEGSSRVYRDDLTANTSVCGVNPLSVQPSEGRVNLDYALSSAPACAGGPCYLWFRIRDDLSTYQLGYDVTAALVNASSAPTAYLYPNDVVFKLAAGSYTVDWMQVVSGGFSERDSCLSPGFTVQAGDPGLPAGQQQLVPASPVLLKATCP